MKQLFSKLRLFDFSELDRQIAKMRDLRDSYRAANLAYYGEQLAALLDD
ncbi:MAG: hypothetical protein HYS23_05880 [Geobacter sp.]|nr:hypothetical protein [Geobacter sp.]